MSKFFVTVRYEFDTLGNLQLANVDKPNFGYHVQSPKSLETVVVDHSPEFESVIANIGKRDSITWINVKKAEPKIAAKRGKAKAKAEAPAEVEITKDMLLALIAKMK